MNNTNIKYLIAVAAFGAAAVLCGCSDKEGQIVPIDATAPVISDSHEIPEEKVNSDVIEVYVCGAVRTPDVYTLSDGDRVTDAVKAAGGFNDDAGKEYLNLAAKLTDGQKIYIPTVQEIEEAIEQGSELYSSKVNITSNTPGVASADRDHQSRDSDGKVDINHADKASLMTLPGVGESKADKIIAYREKNGGFSTIEDIMLVGGIKEGLFNKVKDSICVGR